MKTSISIMVLLAATLAAAAQPVSREQAQQRAEQFLRGLRPGSQGAVVAANTTRARAAAAGAGAESTTTAPYYLFNAADGQGFVIVGGDERARAILGYSDEGTLLPGALPCGLQLLLDYYADELAHAPAATTGSATATQARVRRAPANRTNVSPLLTCQWGQSSPYNLSCPKSGSSQCIVGCAATATAQIMYYWGHQQGCDLPSTAIPAYTTRTLGLSCDELPATRFDWASMANTCTTGTSGQAASKLCRYVGQALEMDYGKSASEAWGSDIGIVLRDYFGYDPLTRLVFRQDYDYDDFEQMLYDELAAGRPVLVTGSYINSDGTSWGGHSFVCHGYQASTGYYRINWGWNGSYDGYFPLTALNSSGATGTGSGSYNVYLNCVMGIQPPVEGHEATPEEPRTAIVDMALNGSRTLTRANRHEAFTGVSVFNAVYNHLQHNAELTAGLGLYDADGRLLSVLTEAPLGRFDRYDGFGLEFTFGNCSLGRDLPDGTYYIRAISRGGSDDVWRLSSGADHHFVTATMDETELVLQPSVDLNVSRVSTATSGWTRTYVATVTNNGTHESRGLLYVFGSQRLLNVVQTDLAPGETRQLSLATASITKITSDFDGHHVLWASSQTVPNIALTAQAPQADREGRFAGQRLLLDVTLTNNGTTTYNTSVEAALYRAGTTTAAASQRFTPTVEAGMTTTERLTFDNLTYAQPYTIVLTSGSYTTQQGTMTTSQPRTFYVYTVTPTKVLLGDVNGDGNVDAADVTALVSILLGQTANGNDGLDRLAADVNGDGAVTIADVTALVNLILAP